MTNAHLAQPFVFTGTDLDEAESAAIVLHGMGGSPEFMIAALIDRIDVPGVGYVLPRAAQNSWYPARFIEPVAANQPHLDHALQTCDAALRTVNDHGIAAERTFLIGFSQGACLMAEYVLRNPRPYAGVALLTGGYVGPPEQPRRLGGSLSGTPVFLGSSRHDGQVPLWRVEETAALLQAMDAQVTLEIYEDREHFVNQAAIEQTTKLITRAR